MFNANAHKPSGLLLRAIDHLTQEAIVVVIDRHKRGVPQRLAQPDLSAAVADVLDLTMQDLATCSKYVHGGGLIQLVALIPSLIRLLIKRDRRIGDDDFGPHDHMFGVSGKEY